MKIIRAEKMGFCAGVRHAVTTADTALQQNSCGQVYSFGPLIHNPLALKKFENRGLKILSEEQISSLKREDTVVIRAHGVPPEVKERLEKTGAKVLDGTCPIVRANQKKCEGFAEEGCVIFFTGDANHGEVIGIEGAARRGAEKSGKELNFILVKSPETALFECEKVLSKNREKQKNCVLISQTTFSVKLFDQIALVLKEKIPELKVLSTICPATYDRQDSLTDLCRLVDGVLVIGGKNSANTNRLLDKAEKLCTHAVLIETADEIPEFFFGLERVGLTAGASTPDDVIDDVEKRLREKSSCSKKTGGIKI